MAEIRASRELIEEARAWVLACEWRETPEELEEYDDQTVLRNVHRHYEGGLTAFAQHSFLDEPEIEDG